MGPLGNAALVGILIAPGCLAQEPTRDTLFFLASSRLTIRAMHTVPAIDLTPGLHVHTVVGNTASVSVAELDSGAIVGPHHHTREQVDVGRRIAEGSLVLIPGNPTSARMEPLGSSSTAIIEFQMRMADAEREVREADSARFEAMTHGNLTALDSLLGADLSYTHSDGTRESKSVFLNSLRSGELAYLALQPDSVVVRLYGETAILDGRMSVRARSGKQQGSFTVRFLEAYAHRRGHWELVAWQSTLLTPIVREK